MVFAVSLSEMLGAWSLGIGIYWHPYIFSGLLVPVSVALLFSGSVVVLVSCSTIVLAPVQYSLVVLLPAPFVAVVLL